MKGYLNYERNIEKSQIMNLIKLPSKIPRVCTRSQNINRAEQKRKQEKKRSCEAGKIYFILRN